MFELFWDITDRGNEKEDSNFRVMFPLKKALQQHGRWAFNPKSS